MAHSYAPVRGAEVTTAEVTAVMAERNGNAMKGEIAMSCALGVDVTSNLWFILRRLFVIHDLEYVDMQRYILIRDLSY